MLQDCCPEIVSANVMPTEWAQEPVLREIFADVQLNGLEQTAVRIVRQFEDITLDHLTFLDFIKIAQSKYGPLFGYMAEFHEAGVRTASALHHFYAAKEAMRGTEAVVHTTDSLQRACSVMDVDIEHSLDPEWNMALAQAFKRLDKVRVHTFVCDL